MKLHAPPCGAHPGGGPGERRQGHRPSRRVALACLVLGGVLPASASEYGLDFSKDFGVWSWNHRLGWDRSVGQRLLVSTNTTFDRKLSKSPGFTRRSDEAGAAMRVTYAFTPELSLGVGTIVDRSVVRSGAIRSEVADDKITSFLSYRPFSGLTLSHSLGSAYETRRGVSDVGLAYGLGLTARPFDETFGAHGLSVVLDYAREGVKSRQGDVLTRLGASGSFAWTGWLSQDAQYTTVRDEQKYVSASPGNPLQRRLAENRAVITNLNALPPLIGRFLLEGGYTSGRVDDDASADPNDLKYRTNNRTRGWSSAATWTLPLPRPTIRYVVSLGRTERRAEPVVIAAGPDSLITRPNDLDRNTSDLSMSVSTLTTFGERDSVRVSGTLALVRDHTPAQTEVNDRDDYRRSVVASYWHQFDRSASLDLRIERTDAHQVWLTRERSANNKWDRVLNFWATVQVERGRATLTQRGFFRTALEEFDFDYLTPDRPRSRNSRVARLDFEGALRVAEGATLRMTYSVEARTLGNLLPAGPGRRPKVWQLTQNELAQVLSLGLTTPFGRSWELGPSLSLNRQSEYLPTRPRWNPLRLGELSDRQEGMQIEAYVSYRPQSGFLAGSDALTVRMSRAYRRRAGLHDMTTYISLAYQHSF